MKEAIHNAVAAVIAKIRNFVSPPEHDITNTGPDIIGLKQELKLLENQRHAIDTEKIELEKLLSDFQLRHSQELGEILLEILRLRKLLYQSDKLKFEEAEKDEKQYRKRFTSDRKKQKYQLTYVEKKEMKKKFRMATLLCHPDKLNEKLKEAAQGIFIRLKAAYDSNNLQRVSEILNDLEKGQYFKSNSDSVSESELLKTEIAKLRKRINSLEKQIVSIRNSDAYKTVMGINDWDGYFRNMKIKLETELEEMKKQIEAYFFFKSHYTF